jgi:KDO2-lipid IV(A) lauroyltransferase
MSYLSAATDAPPRVAGWQRLLARLPDRVMYGIASGVGWFLFSVMRFRRAIGVANMARCFPSLPAAERERLLAKHYREMTGVALETFKLAVFDGEDLRQRVQLVNPDEVFAQLQRGDNVLLLNAHQGNWEWLLQRMALEFPRFVCAYKPIRSARLDADMLSLRGRFGAQLVPAKGLLRALRRTANPHVTGLVADQMPRSSPTRVWVDLLGQQTAFYPGPGEIAGRYGYSGWFLAMQRMGDGRYQVTFHPLCEPGERLPAEEFTRRYAQALGDQLRRAPSDWAWGHRRWKLQPPI